MGSLATKTYRGDDGESYEVTPAGEGNWRDSPFAVGQALRQAPPVLPPAYIANTTPIDVCPCQWSASGHCAKGQHEKCPRTWGWKRHGEPVPETHIVSRRGWTALTPVWRVGKPCRWLCPCICHATVQALFPSPPRGPGRVSRTGGNGYLGIASTDRIDRDEVPGLFDFGGSDE